MKITGKVTDSKVIDTTWSVLADDPTLVAVGITQKGHGSIFGANGDIHVQVVMPTAAARHYPIGREVDVSIRPR